MEPVLVAAVAALAVALLVVARLARERGRELDRIRDLLGVGPGADPTLRIRELLEAAAPGRIERIAADMAALADALPVGVVRLDDARRVVFANGPAHRILGRPPGSLIGRTAMEVFVDPRIEAALAGSKPLELTVRDGEPRIVRVAARPSAVRGTWLVLEDLTELRRLEQIRTEFVDNLSHELRTPLTTIGLLAETLARELEAAGPGAPAERTRPDLGRLRDRVAKIEAETGHLNQMVAEMLDLARIESGRAIPLTDRVDLARLAAEAAERLRPFADRNRIRVSVTTPESGELPSVVGNAERLGQVLVNLLHNAIKFSPEGGPVEVRLERVPEGVRLAVRDEGIGIPREAQARIFERFYKVDRTRGRGGGTGLGLAIARHVVEAHGGRIWVESAEGHGSTFFVVLPAAR